MTESVKHVSQFEKIPHPYPLPKGEGKNKTTSPKGPPLSRRERGRGEGLGGGEGLRKNEGLPPPVIPDVFYRESRKERKIRTSRPAPGSPWPAKRGPW